jgi:hypothetical protein
MRIVRNLVCISVLIRKQQGKKIHLIKIPDILQKTEYDSSLAQSKSVFPAIIVAIDGRFYIFHIKSIYLFERR